MATAHVYVRVQVCGSNDQITRVADIAQALQASVESFGEWKGSLSVDLDPEPDPVVEPEPIATSGEFDVDSQ
jgi:hypothetical protein